MVRNKRQQAIGFGGARDRRANETGREEWEQGEKREAGTGFRNWVHGRPKVGEEDDSEGGPVVLRSGRDKPR